MARLSARLAGAATVIAISWLAPPHAASQSAPRTPWGDPDLQGNYTNLWEAGTPFERPNQFAGRRIEQVYKSDLDVASKQEADLAQQLEGYTNRSSDIAQALVPMGIAVVLPSTTPMLRADSL